ncbi:heavy metal sensor histidine kinase [Rhodoferax sp. PAMC 29310]|uniref:heavy metal sensor histidine kinase n=1 Tax=Rhodoferax sp. PAMC 29310 TaxID=2822760 RepID=UPI001B3361EC|nr:heavy metal sensor histidine kinase [Rhodoferax sp. PAMC 29310]
MLVGPTSMIARLTTLFVLVSSLVLMTLGLVIAASVEKHFEDQDMDVLTGKMALAQHTLEKLGPMNDMGAVMQSLDNSLVGHHGLELMVIGSNQQILFSNTMQTFSISTITDSARHSPSKPAIWESNGQSYRGIAAQVTVGPPNSAQVPVTVTVAVAIAIVHHQVFMASFLKTLWAFVFAAALLAGVLGWAVARHGLAPLHTMREQTKAVTARHLSYRLPVDAMPIELGNLAQSLNEMLSRLEDAFVRLTDFSSDIAHELRTPVSNLMMETQVTLSRERSESEYKSILESNVEEFEHLARMISDMLLLAKADNGLFVPHLETIHLAAEVQALLEYYDAVADEKEVHFSVSGDGAVAADRLMLRRALGNLLSNAIRHATPNTSVGVVIQEMPDDFEIRVENTGDVIQPEYLQRVFERFFRADPSRQHRSEGTGLGLAITKSIIVAHGGSISVTSDSRTTAFSIKLPRKS